MGKRREKNWEKKKRTWSRMGKKGKKLVKKGKNGKWEKNKEKNSIGIIFCNNLYSDSRGSVTKTVIKHKNIINQNYSNFFE